MRDRLRLATTAGVCAGILAAAPARAEHREQLAELRTPTVAWDQPRLREGYPAGCGPTALAIVYAYWAQQHGASHLFAGATIASGRAGSDDPTVREAMERIGYLVETDYVEKNAPLRDGSDQTILERGSRAKLGSTKTLDMCKGIAYAQEKGYPNARCFRIRGTEFDKFEHVSRYLKEDRPVILTISTKGQRATNHYVVVEKARKRQEKVGDDWRDRDVEYYVNYGWGGDRGDMPEWISTRQVGINTSQVYTATDAFLISVSEDPLPLATDANEEACKEWCEGPGKAQGCVTCSRLAGCGPGYRHLTDFRSAGKDWYACAQRDTRRAEASEGHREQCEAWCRENPECKTCSTNPGCGVGYKAIKSWTGYGNNYYACAERGPTRREEASEDHHRECQQWCDGHPECVKCATSVGCGVGFESMKSWTGFGQNWYACRQNARQEASDRHKADCESWCQANPGCEMCSTSIGCGRGYESLHSWTGPGRNWYACGKRPTREEASAGNQQECTAWCGSHSGCDKCSDQLGCGRGYKQIKSFGGRGKNWYACEKH